MPTQSDNLVLVERIIGGDQDAVREFDGKYRPRFEGRARRAGIPIHDCLDVAQEILIAAIDQLQRRLFRGESALGTWLDKIIRGKITDYLRSQKEEGRRLTSSSPSEDDNEVALVERLPAMPVDYAAVLSVREALERMPSELRVILVLKVCEGLTLQEIGGGLRRSTTTVHRKLIEAQETFRRLILAGGEQETNGIASR